MASRPMVRGVALASVLVALVGSLALVAAKEDGVPSAGARVTVDGRATLVRVDGSTETLSSGDVVRAGEEVRAEAGTFVLELADGGQLEGRVGFDDAQSTRVIVGERPEVVAGEVLLLGREGLAVDADGTIVALTADDAAARVDRALAVRAASYRGGARIDSAGLQRDVPALRQLGVASLGRPAGSPDPFVVDEEDPWDRRFLGGAISLGRELDRFSESFSLQHHTARRNPTLYEEAVPAVAAEPAFAGLVVDERVDRKAGDLLIGTVLTTLAEGGDFVSRWREVFGFRDEGAGWGLVALDQGLEETAVADAVAAALGRTGDTDPSEVALGGPPPTGRTVPPGTTPPGGTDSGDDGGRSSNGDGGTGPTTTPTTATPTPTVPPTTVPPTTVPPTTVPTPTVPVPTLPPPEEPVPDTGIPLVDDVLEPIEDILGGLLG